MSKSRLNEFIAAAHNGKADELDALLKQHPEYLNAVAENATALHYAAGSGHPGAAQVVKRLLQEKNLEINRPGRNREQTALHFAAGNDSVEIVRLLLDAGAEHKPDRHGCTPIVTAILRRDTDLHWKNNLNYTHIENTRIDIIKLLLEKGGDNTPDREGNTPLHLAVHKNWGEVVTLLLAKGATQTPNKAGDTPLHSGVSRDNAAILMQLLEANPDVNARNSENISPVQHLLPRANHVFSNAQLQQRFEYMVAAGATVPPPPPGAQPLFGPDVMQNAGKIKALHDSGLKYHEIHVMQEEGMTLDQIVDKANIQAERIRGAVAAIVEQASWAEGARLSTDVGRIVGEFVARTDVKNHANEVNRAARAGAQKELNSYPDRIAKAKAEKAAAEAEDKDPNALKRINQSGTENGRGGAV